MPSFGVDRVPSQNEANVRNLNSGEFQRKHIIGCEQLIFSHAEQYAFRLRCLTSLHAVVKTRQEKRSKTEKIETKTISCDIHVSWRCERGDVFFLFLPGSQRKNEKPALHCFAAQRAASGYSIRTEVKRLHTWLLLVHEQWMVEQCNNNMPK
ncbi:hypothetical protein CAPTEDRAFT_191369 [Capitella teleta]|uniref:Uncharacterized protein n=1 Tax=Capitella teleta TaxID=283909 RepID=R7UGT3_CAPTE|nr:hypothetical protein CAPTEDRAFT_191369 [Capitella teleta]|eukprot:ELU02467.1 hypothetical protein CAPTEDRAFT_191369 [Capitella teleta]